MWKKCESYTWKADVRYYLYYLPIEIIKAFLAMRRKDHILMTKRDYLSLARGMADIRSGRLCEWVDEK